jgi:hypothetical protein
MLPEELKREIISVLSAEVDSIHSENTLFWRQRVPSRDERGAYCQRLDRLEEIRRRFAELHGATDC